MMPDAIARDRFPPADAANADLALAIKGSTKSYGATRALNAVSLDVRHGEIHAIIGENGAGKSTLVKILSGIVAPDAGEIAIAGTPFRPRSLMSARAAGVATAFQELSLLPNLTVAANLMLPHLVKGFAGLISTKGNEHAAAAALAEFGAADIAPAALVSELSLAERQRVELVRALSLNPSILILDEPTAALAEPAWLFEAVERMAAGGTAIIYITHRLAEVRRLCTRATVLRNGEKIGTVDVARVTDAEIFRMMVGAAPQRRANTRAAHAPVTVPTAIRARDLRGRSVTGISFDLRRGEILGIAALEGQGQRELFRMLAGAAPVESGTIEVEGRIAILASPAQAVGAGIGFLPEERKTEGIFAGLLTRANISLLILRRLRRFGLIDRARERALSADVAQRLDLGAQVLDRDIAALSGGNQQKTLVARTLLSGARTLVLFDPTRGVDVGTKQTLYAVIRRFAADGGSVLIYSTELEELVQLVDRCLVMYRGQIVGEAEGHALSEDELIELATGHGRSPGVAVERSPVRSVARQLVGMLGDGAVISTGTLLALLAIFALGREGAHDLDGVTHLLNNALPVAIAAAGSTLVVLTREFDLSVAGVIALANVLIVAVIGANPWAPVTGLALVLAVGSVVGLINGLLVAYLDLQSIAATLGTMIICSGLALLVLAVPGGDVADTMANGLTGTVGPVPVAALIAAGVALLWTAIRYTDWGVALYAVGGDQTAAALAGINTRKARLLAFCFAGAFYGLAGYMLTAFTATGDPHAGQAYLILVYAAIAIGGTSFAGGRGGLITSMIGAAILILLQKVLFSLGILSFYMGIVEGLIMILAVMIGAFSERVAKAGGR